jgi:hypothetical protein
MKTDCPKLTKLQAKVTAAQQEFDLAVAFHEVWKPTAYDQGLHGRLGVSHATQAFRVIRTALRRELILALIRLWDKDGRTIGMECIAKALGKKEVIDALTLARVDKNSEDFDAMQDDLRKRADEVIRLVEKYMNGGAGHAVYAKLRDLRNERLAHRQVVTKVRATGATTTDGSSCSGARIECSGYGVRSAERPLTTISTGITGTSVKFSANIAQPSKTSRDASISLAM